MPIPRIAIVGRPNVGKSSLLNMIAREKVSIVDPTAGTTRDRVSVIVDLIPPYQGHDSKEKITTEVTDTGGFGVYVEDGRRFDDVGKDLGTLTDDIEFQISQAVSGADVVLFVIDAQAGVTAADQKIARLLRERVIGKRGAGTKGKKSKRGKGKVDAESESEDVEGSGKTRQIHIRVAANKCDGPKWEAHALEAAGLGFGEPIPVSAKNNYFRRDFLESLYEEVAALPGVQLGRISEPPELKIAIIGKRNSGKSSIVNALAGEERVIVSEIAGTTRDAVDVRISLDGRDFIVIDTAGLRKKKSFADRIEWWAFDRAQRSIERSDVVIMLVDAAEPLSQIDQQLMKLVQNSYKPCIIAVNKWDLTAGRDAGGGGGKWKRGDGVTPEMYEEYLREETKGLDFAPLAFISAKNKTGLRELIQLAFDLHEQSSTRAPTGKLNRLLSVILTQRGPSSKLGTFAKAYFISQVAVRPPTVVLVVNRPELFTPNYQRFLLNRLRETLDFPEVPIRLIVKERKRARIEDLLSGEHQRLKEAGAKVVESDVAAEVAIDDETEAAIPAKGTRRKVASKPARGHVIDEDGLDLTEDIDIDEGDDELVPRPTSRKGPVEDPIEKDFSVEDLPDDAASYFADKPTSAKAPSAAPLSLRPELVPRGKKKKGTHRGRRK